MTMRHLRLHRQPASTSTAKPYRSRGEQLATLRLYLCAMSALPINNF